MDEYYEYCLRWRAKDGTERAYYAATLYDMSNLQWSLLANGFKVQIEPIEAVDPAVEPCSICGERAFIEKLGSNEYAIVCARGHRSPTFGDEGRNAALDEWHKAWRKAMEYGTVPDSAINRWYNRPQY